MIRSDSRQFRKTLLLFLFCTAFCSISLFPGVVAEKTATTLIISISPEDPPVIPSYAVNGSLTDATGKPLGNKRVILESSKPGSGDQDEFAFTAILDTWKDGTYQFIRPVGSLPEFFRVRFDGNDEFEPSTSQVIPARAVTASGPLTSETGTEMVFVNAQEKGKIATSLNIDISPDEPTINESFYVTGTLADSSGKSLGNKRIILESMTDGNRNSGEYAVITIKETAKNGNFSFFRPVDSPPEFLRARFAGNDEYDPSTSPDVSVRGAGTANPQVRAGKTGSITVSTEPQGADIYIDGVLQGVSYKTISGLPEGPYVVTISKQGYQNQTEEAYVTATRDVYYEITLK